MRRDVESLLRDHLVVLIERLRGVNREVHNLDNRKLEILPLTDRTVKVDKCFLSSHNRV